MCGVGPADRNTNVVTDLCGIVGIPIRREDNNPFGHEPGVHDAVAVAGRPRLALLVGRIEVELTAEDAVIELHRLFGLALEIDVRSEELLCHTALLIPMRRSM